METTTHLFLATRFNCNKCHDHPFERWTQNQYYELSSFFAQISRTEDPKHKGKKTEGTAVRGALPLVEIIKDGTSPARSRTFAPARGQALLPVSACRQSPRWRPAAGASKWPSGSPPRTIPISPRATSTASGATCSASASSNRWTTSAPAIPPSNPQLLDRLTQEFIKSGFNVQELIKTICKSRTYQHSLATNRWNEDDETNYSHALARRLSAEVLYDAIHRSLGSKSKLPGLPAGARAAQLGRCQRALAGVVPGAVWPAGRAKVPANANAPTACCWARCSAWSMARSSTTPWPIRSNRIAQILAREKDDARVVEELYLAILCRPPTPKEVKVALEAFTGNDAEFAKLQAEKKKRDQDVAEYEKKLPELQAQWERDVQRPPVWTVLEPDGAEVRWPVPSSPSKTDNSILATGPNPSPGHLHRDRQDQPQGHHGHSPGSPGRSEPAEQRPGPGAPTATSS